MKTNPRDSFRLTGKAAELKRLLANEAFDVACDYSLLQLLSEMPANLQPGAATDVMIGFDANAQMAGAARVLEILKTLADPVKPPTTPKRDTLHYG